MTQGKKKKEYGCFASVAIIFLLFILISTDFGILLLIVFGIIGVIFYVVYHNFFSLKSRKQENNTNIKKGKKALKPQRIIEKHPPKKVVSHEKKRPHWTWMGFGSQIRVGPHTIKDPLTYYSDDNPGDEIAAIAFNIEGETTSIIYPYETDEASCIYTGLPIGTPLDEGKGTLGYWPNYSKINPNQRANYLEWLAGERKGELTDIGYAFLFFYGLERRVLIEKKDINLIIRIVMRLLRRYPFSDSFNGYLGNFIAYVVARVGILKFNENWFNLIFACRLRYYYCFRTTAVTRRLRLALRGAIRSFWMIQAEPWMLLIRPEVISLR